jgi:signal transduction histidine kinase
MKLRQKTLYLIGGTLLVLLLLIALVVTRQSVRGFEKLEQVSLTRDMERVTNTLEYEFEKQSEYLKTWAYWNDTQAFVQGEFPQYPETFTLDDVFPVYNKQAVIFTNLDGQTIYAKEYSEAGAVELSPELLAVIESYLRRSSDDLSETSGILRVPSGLAFFVALPVLNNEGQGPAAGTMMTVSHLNETYLEELKQQTRLSVTVHLNDDGGLPEDVGRAKTKLDQSDDPALVTPLDSEIAAAYSFIHDIKGEHVGIVRVEEQRSIYQQGVRQLVLMLVSLGGIGIIFIALVLVLLERTVLSRLSYLSHKVRDITQSAEMTTRVEVLGKDELAMLASDLNSMLQVIEERTVALERSNQELARSNQELERFSYVASHDLQEPLRKVQTFSDRLTSKYGDKLEGDGKIYLSRMQESLGRMRGLIQDLLNYSRVQNSKKEWVTLDLNDVVKGVVSDLEVRLEQSGGHIEVGQLPTVEADPLQMRQVFQNLLSNALKFKRPDVAPVVKVVSRLVGDSYEIVVKDNGIGFEQQYANKVFEVFQRLHSRGDYEGTGIGLAIVRKVLESHGGSVRVESTPNQGTQFFLTLPVTSQPQPNVAPKTLEGVA